MRQTVLYMRMSTDRQENSVDSQRNILAPYAKNNGMEIVHEYIDSGISGRSADKRPAFLQMIDDSANGNFDTVLIYDSSRFARNLAESIVYKKILEKNGVTLVSATEPTLDDDTALITDALFGAMNEMFSRKLSKNVKRGMRHTAELGIYQTIPPFGYTKKSGDTHLSVDASESKIVKCIFEDYLKGTSIWKITRNLDDMGIRTRKGNKFRPIIITKMLRNKVYIGYTIFKDIVNESTHPAIIDDDTFAKIQDKLDLAYANHRANARPHEKTLHWLTGILKCRDCGCNMYYRSGTNSSPQFRSPQFRCSSYARADCKTCNTISCKKLEKHIINYLSEISKDIEIVKTIKITKRPTIGDEKTVIQEKIRKLSAKKERAKQGYLNGILDANESKIICSDCDTQLAKLESDLAAIDVPVTDYTELQQKILNLCNTLSSDAFTKDEKQIAIREVVEKILVDRKNNILEVFFYQ
ncbi:hypothetical protein AGMMS49975_27620 [Clostridia bacterium]|nr:hypothetical protein AGMMS49975_27620 [Clostridia bacterium]